MCLPESFSFHIFLLMVGFGFPKSLVGLRLVSLLSILSDAVSDAVLHIPSILFLDDLDIIAGMVSDTCYWLGYHP